MRPHHCLCLGTNKTSTLQHIHIDPPTKPPTFNHAPTQEPNIDTYIIERKMDNAKPCGGAIPLCMIDEFQLPVSVVDRKVNKQS